MAVAAKELGLPKAKYVLGIPLAARAKNPYFNRRWARLKAGRGYGA